MVRRSETGVEAKSKGSPSSPDEQQLASVFRPCRDLRNWRPDGCRSGVQTQRNGVNADAVGVACKQAFAIAAKAKIAPKRIIEVTRAVKVWDIRRRCIRANAGVLYNDHGDVLKRVVSQGVSVSTKMALADVLATWKWVYEQRARKDESDQDAVDVFDEIAAQIEVLWDSAVDLNGQSDKCIDFLAEHLLIEIPRAKRMRT
jgi:hypothetical protein